MIHAPVYPFNPCRNAAKCGSSEGAEGQSIGSLYKPLPVDCPDCIRIRAEEDAAWMVRRRAAAEQERAAEAVADAVGSIFFGWAA